MTLFLFFSSCTTEKCATYNNAYRAKEQMKIAKRGRYKFKCTPKNHNVNRIYMNRKFSSDYCTLK